MGMSCLHLLIIVNNTAVNMDYRYLSKLCFPMHITRLGLASLHDNSTYNMFGEQFSIAATSFYSSYLQCTRVPISLLPSPLVLPWQEKGRLLFLFFK